MSELLLADYNRRGILDGVGIRLPTICVRPGKPNKAASGFFSGIIREPLAGMEAMLPVAETVRHTHASPRSAVGFLDSRRRTDARAARPAHQSRHARRVLHGRRADRVADPHCRDQGRRAHPRSRTSSIMRIVGRLAGAVRRRNGRGRWVSAPRASFDEIIRAHIDDELGGKIARLSRPFRGHERWWLPSRHQTLNCRHDLRRRRRWRRSAKPARSSCTARTPSRACARPARWSPNASTCWCRM